MKYGVFTKPVHIEKIVSFLNTTDLDYVISSQRKEIYAYKFDIGISYCFPWIIDIARGSCEWYNYHPAPLPEYPGLRNYADAIRNNITEYGVTLHKMSKVVDMGEVVKVKTFKLETVPVNTSELGCITHYYLFQLFKETIVSLC